MMVAPTASNCMVSTATECKGTCTDHCAMAAIVSGDAGDAQPSASLAHAAEASHRVSLSESEAEPEELPPSRATTPAAAA